MRNQRDLFFNKISDNFSGTNVPIYMYEKKITVLIGSKEFTVASNSDGGTGLIGWTIHNKIMKKIV